MTPSAIASNIDDIARDLDLLVYRLEVDSPRDADAVSAERKRLRRELESLRERLEDLVRLVGS
jgi:hypothetical protein